MSLLDLKRQVGESIRGRFDLEEGQALIFECEVPKARYWHVALLNSPWFETLDYMDHQSCLNGAQIQPDADGRFRVVVSPEDPGVPNWIDTEQRPRGMLVYRWVFSRTRPVPDATLVSLADLRSLLPPEHPSVDAALRRRRLAERRELAWARFR